MKKIVSCFFIISLFIFYTANGFAESKSYIFDNEDIVLQAGFGLGLVGMYGDTIIPPVSFSVDYGKDIAVGANKIKLPFSFGGLIGQARSEDKWGTSVKYTYSYLIIGRRVSYHFIRHLNINAEKLDLYGGVLLGYNYVSSSVDAPSGYDTDADGSYIMTGCYGGARYFFTPNLGVYGEIGYGVGYLNFGVSYKL